MQLQKYYHACRVVQGISHWPSYAIIQILTPISVTDKPILIKLKN